MRRSHRTTDPLAAVPLFATCSNRERARIAQQAEQVRVAAGTPIATEGATSRALWVILTGEVELHVAGRALGRLGPGDHLGEVSALSGEPLAVSATAATDVELVEIGHRELAALIEIVPPLARRLLRDLAASVHPVAAA